MKPCDTQINKSNNQSDFSDYWMKNTNDNQIDVTLKLKDIEQVILPLSFIHINLRFVNILINLI